MWRKAGTKAPELCRSCRTAARGGLTTSEFRALSRRTIPVEAQLRLMSEARLAERDKTCECGRTFRGNALRELCDGCRDQRRGHRERKKNARRQNRSGGRLYLDTGELITISALGDRDKWTCWLCNEFVNRALGNRDPWMPSFDHVQPISLGGMDSWDNLRLAHLICNTKRGNRVAA